MKYSMVVLLLGMMGMAAIGQEKLPPFRIGLIDGKYLDSRELHLQKPVLFVYFDPACEECRAFTRMLEEDQSLLRQYEVLMVTNTDLVPLQRFAGEFRLGHQKGLVIGTEGWTRSLQRALGISRFPYVAVYNKTWHLVQHVDAPASKGGFESLKKIGKR